MNRSLVFLPLVILMAFTLGCQDQQALAELEGMKAQAEVEEQNKEVVLESIRGIDAQDFESLRDLWTGWVPRSPLHHCCPVMSAV